MYCRPSGWQVGSGALRSPIDGFNSPVCVEILLAVRTEAVPAARIIYIYIYIYIDIDIEYRYRSIYLSIYLSIYMLYMYI